MAEYGPLICESLIFPEIRGNASPRKGIFDWKSASPPEIQHNLRRFRLPGTAGQAGSGTQPVNQTNSRLTDSLRWMRLIASPSSGATLRTVTLSICFSG